MVHHNITPAMKQYFTLKQQYPDCLLIYRSGDFFEFFGEEAERVHDILNIRLTEKGSKSANEKGIAMCGVPVNSLHDYLRKLVKHGFKVAICDQLETLEEAKKRGGSKAIIRRDVVRVVTPGTLIDDDLLDAKSNNYLACLVNDNDNYSIAWLDISTGEFFYTCTSLNNLNNDLHRISPKELLISDKLYDLEELRSILNYHKITITKHSSSFFEANKANNILCEFYQLKTLQGIGKLNNIDISACGSLLEYVKITQKGSTPRLQRPKLYSHTNYMVIDSTTIKNLELFETQSGEYSGSLLSCIDYTKTSAGTRLLKQFLSYPLSCPYSINHRLEVVEFFIKNPTLRKNIRTILKNCSDIDRILSRTILNKSSPKDLCLLKESLCKALELSHLLYGIDDSPKIIHFYENLGEYTELTRVLNEALLENNITNVKDGGFINPEFDPKLSELLYIQNNSNILLEKLRNNYRKITGIPSLKIMYNNIIGYYIEVSTNHTINNKYFIHRQSLSNSVRYTSEELKDLENKIISAKNSTLELETQIFYKLCAQISKHSDSIAITAYTISELDFFTALSELATQNNYVKPIIDNSFAFNITKGRHPVVEKYHKFIANNIDLSEKQRVCLITGPNMAGKSTLLRQNALITILSHIGSFVPAEYAHIGIVDRVFSRVGASDNISAGHSTFMVEMIETANIINHSTKKSLVILDEVGRGTGIYDGLSIAYSVVEYIHDVNQCRAIFATHYYELSNLENHLKCLKCFHMKVEEWHEKIIFLYELIAGPTHKSYGIHVAKLAGFPDSLLNRAKTIMQKFVEQNNYGSI